MDLKNLLSPKLGGQSHPSPPSLWRGGISGCALALCIGITPLWTSALKAQSAPTPSDPPMVARVLRAVGAAQAERGGKTVPLHAGDGLRTGDLVTTGPQSALRLASLGAADDVVLLDNSRLLVGTFSIGKDVGGQRDLFTLPLGRVRFLFKGSAGSGAEIRTSNSVMGLRGTGGYLSVEGDGSGVVTRLLLTDGVVQMANSAQRTPGSDAVEVKSGYWTEVRQGSAPTAPILIPQALLREWEQAVAQGVGP